MTDIDSRLLGDTKYQIAARKAWKTIRSNKAKSLAARSLQLAGLVSYVKTRFNSTLNMVAVGTGTSTAGVVFNWMVDGTPAPNVAEFWRILPNENWKDAVGLWGLDASDPMAQEIFAAIENLKSTVGWHPPWNDDALVGQVIPYSKHNTNITFTPISNMYACTVVQTKQLKAVLERCLSSA